ncbi:adenosylmethionine--8-amino-7-oxononanoate transaminase [Thiovibrio sp. JS02]
MDSLQEKDRKFLWHPYTQMRDYAQRDLLLIDRAQGTRLHDANGFEYFDTISSWWCIVHGHSHPLIVERLRAQLNRLDQVLLAGTSHEGAILLAEKLVSLAPENLAKVFYSDNGSTACEIAIKMSLQYWRQVGQPKRTRLVALERGYHGDTIGTMSLGGVPEFHSAFASLLFASHRLPSPYCYRCPVGQAQESCDCQCLLPLAELLAAQGDEVAALIVEPLIQAAGGMIVYPGKYLKKLVFLCRRAGVHVIFDEVATGFGRTGTMFALEQAGVAPDFLCLSKGLTAGLLPMAATLTSEEVYQAFYADYAEGKTFFHGHTFTGNPLAAAAALASLEVFAREETMAGLPEKISFLQKRMQRFADLPWVGDLRQLGMISAMELVRDKGRKEAYDFAERVGWPIYLAGLKEGLLLRPIGNVIYLWLPLSVTLAEIEEITERVWRVLSDSRNIKGW